MDLGVAERVEPAAEAPLVLSPQDIIAKNDPIRTSDKPQQQQQNKQQQQNQQQQRLQLLLSESLDHTQAPLHPIDLRPSPLDATWQRITGRTSIDRRLLLWNQATARTLLPIGVPRQPKPFPGARSPLSSDCSSPSSCLLALPSPSSSYCSSPSLPSSPATTTTISPCIHASSSSLSEPSSSSSLTPSRFPRCTSCPIQDTPAIQDATSIQDAPIGCPVPQYPPSTPLATARAATSLHRRNATADGYVTRRMTNYTLCEGNACPASPTTVQATSPPPPSLTPPRSSCGVFTAPCLPSGGLCGYNKAGGVCGYNKAEGVCLCRKLHKSCSSLDVLLAPSGTAGSGGNQFMASRSTASARDTTSITARPSESVFEWATRQRILKKQLRLKGKQA